MTVRGYLCVIVNACEHLKLYSLYSSNLNSEYDIEQNLYIVRRLYALDISQCIKFSVYKECLFLSKTSEQKYALIVTSRM